MQCLDVAGTSVCERGVLLREFFKGVFVCGFEHDQVSALIIEMLPNGS